LRSERTLHITTNIFHHIQPVQHSTTQYIPIRNFFFGDGFLDSKHTS
jgi:hypothetical protein